MEIVTDAGRETFTFFDTTPPRSGYSRPGKPGNAGLAEIGSASRPLAPNDLTAPFFDGGAADRFAAGGLGVPERFRLMILQRKAHRSNLDLLTDLARKGVALPDGLVCVALQGENFLGRFDRGWRCLPGNVHAVVHLAPRLAPEEAGCAFSILAALACADAIDALSGPGSTESEPRLKWINDVFLGTSKVAGVLTRQTFQAPVITDVFLGIGVNVLAAPDLPPTAFVPSACCLADRFPDRPWSPGLFLKELLVKVDSLYALLLAAGPAALVALYRRRAAFLGRPVRIYEDGFGFGEGGPAGRKLVVQGTVESIGDDLSLRLAGREPRIDGGRLAFEEDCLRLDGSSGSAPEH